MSNSLLRKLFCIFGLVFFFQAPAYAYIDPGTAGLLYQFLYVAVAAIVGYFAGLKHLIARIFKRSQKTIESGQDIEEEKTKNSEVKSV